MGLHASINNSVVYIRLIVVPLFNYVYQGDTSLGGSKIVLVIATFELSAGDALVLVVVGVDVAQPDGRFEVPAFAQQPRIAIGKSNTCRPSLIAVVLGGLALERNTHAADVVEGITAVQSKEMAIKFFTEPIPELRHDHPVLYLLVAVLIQRPRVVAPP